MLLTFSSNAKRIFLTSGPGAERLDISRQTCAMWDVTKTRNGEWGMGNGEWDDSGEWEIEMGIWKKN